MHPLHPQALASEAMATTGISLGLPSSKVDPYVATHKALSGKHFVVCQENIS
jgi:hypothetical protein